MQWANLLRNSQVPRLRNWITCTLFTGREDKTATWPPISFTPKKIVLMPVVDKECRLLIFVWGRMGRPFMIPWCVPGGTIQVLPADARSAEAGFISRFV